MSKTPPALRRRRWYVAMTRYADGGLYIGPFWHSQHWKNRWAALVAVATRRG